MGLPCWKLLPLAVTLLFLDALSIQSSILRSASTTQISSCSNDFETSAKDRVFSKTSL